MFAFFLLVFLGLVLTAIFTGLSSIPLNAVLIGAVFAYLFIFLGRLTGYLKHAHIFYIPVLIGLGTAGTWPLLKYTTPWIGPSPEVPISFVFKNVPGIDYDVTTHRSFTNPEPTVRAPAAVPDADLQAQVEEAKRNAEKYNRQIDSLMNEK